MTESNVITEIPLNRIEHDGEGVFVMYQGGIEAGWLKDGVTPLIHATWANLMNTDPELADTYLAGVAQGMSHMVARMAGPEYAKFMVNEDKPA